MAWTDVRHGSGQYIDKLLPPNFLGLEPKLLGLASLERRNRDDLRYYGDKGENLMIRSSIVGARRYLNADRKKSITAGGFLAGMLIDANEINAPPTQWPVKGVEFRELRDDLNIAIARCVEGNEPAYIQPACTVLDRAGLGTHFAIAFNNLTGPELEDVEMLDAISGAAVVALTVEFLRQR